MEFFSVLLTENSSFSATVLQHRKFKIYDIYLSLLMRLKAIMNPQSHFCRESNFEIEKTEISLSVVNTVYNVLNSGALKITLRITSSNIRKHRRFVLNQEVSCFLRLTG